MTAVFGLVGLALIVALAIAYSRRSARRWESVNAGIKADIAFLRAIPGRDEALS